MQEEAPAIDSTTQHPGESSASIWRKFVRLIHSIIALMRLPVLALLVGITLCCAAAGQTATSLSVSSGAITVGASETLTATVLSGGLPVTAGSVEFRDNLASPGGSVLGKTPLNGSGSGQLALSSVGPGVHLGMGLHEISAIYTGSSGLAISVSSYQAVTVSGTSQLPTTTAISSTGVAGNYMLTGMVTALTTVLPTGMVSFLDASNGNAVLNTQTLDPASKGYGFAAFSTAPGVGGATSVAVGDFNGDGNLDLAVTNSYSGTVSILLGDGAGNFTTFSGSMVSVGSGTTSNPFSIAVGDFNSDGNLDLAVANFGDGTVSILLGDGTGFFHPAPTPIVTVGRGPYSIAVGDFTGDGVLDLAVANSGDNTVSILVNDGTGKFSPAATPTVAVGVSPLSVVVGDFLGNGKFDLAVVNSCGTDSLCSAPGTVSILLGDGTGNFTPATTLPVGYSPYSVAVGDFNGDGVLDLAVANSCGNDPLCNNSPGTVSILLGDGTGSFSSAATSPVTVGVNPRSVAVGDFNGDGSLDLTVVNFNDNTVTILKGDGTGNFAPATTTPVPVGVNPTSVAVGDFNGDGNPDLAVANFDDGTVTVLHALWTESATAPVSFSTPPSHNVLASYAGDAIYTPSQSTAIPLLGLLNTGLVWTPTYAIIQGTSLSGLLNATTTYGGLPATNLCSYTSTPTGGIVYNSTVLDVGSYTLGVTCTGDYPTVTGTRPLTVYHTGYVLTTGTNNPSEGTVTPASGGTYAPTLVIAISATANPGYIFEGWESNAAIASTSNASTSVTMNSAETVTADFEAVPTFVVNTNQDDISAPVASNCPANPSGRGSGPCTLRDALLAAAGVGGNILFDPTVFSASNTAAANTITLGADGPLSIPTNTILTGATSGSGVTLTNLVTVNGASASTVFTLSGSTVAILNNLTIEDGTSGGNGGGISNNGTLTVNQSTFNGNSAIDGGGIDSSGTLTVSGSTFNGNSATIGGGICVESGGSVTVSGSTFFGNAGTTGGGAIDATVGGPLAVSSSTISGNSSTNSTGGIAGPVSSFPMSNSIATGNVNGDCSVSGGSCPANGTGGNVLGVAANLAALGNYGGPTQTMIPLPGSVAICAIVPTGTGTDQRGMPWPVSYNVTSCQDSGAVQTDYSLSFVQQPSTTLILTPISPAPTVEFDESGSPFASSVTIPLTLKDSGGNDITSLDLSGGSANTSSGVATYSPLDVDAPGTGDTLAANLSLNSTTAISSTSSPFDVTLKPTTTVASDASAVYLVSQQSVTLSATVTSSYGAVNAGTVTFTVMQSSTPIGSPVTSGTVSSGAASVTYTLPGGTSAGGYSIQAVYNTGGGFATSSDSTHTLTVGMVTVTPTLGNLLQIYTGSPLAATATTSPSGLTVNFTYNGSSTAPTAVGSYTVVGTISDENYQGSSSSTLVISQATPAIPWATPAAIPYGTALSATQLDASSAVAGTFVYNPAAGAVLGVGPQTLSVTLTPTDSTDYMPATVYITLVVNKGAPGITWATPAAITYGTALSATQLNANTTVAGTYVYTPAAGAVLTAGLQTLSVTFTPTDSSDYLTATSTVQLTVNKATPAISWATPAAIPYGTALSATQLDASSTVAGTFVYTPAAGAVPTAGLQTLSVTFTPTDSSDYTTATATVQLTVNKAAPVVTWATPVAIPYGTALSAVQLDAGSTVAGTFVYTPAAGAVPMAGLQTLSVTFTPTDSTDYSTATATVQLTVNAAAPAIPWATPAAITYGTALSAAQLDASSTVAGTFVYTPAAGAVLTAGLQTLSVTFTPTDSSDYTTATATVQLTVNKAAPVVTWATPVAIPYGTALSAAQLDAGSTVAGTFVYTPAAGAVLTAGLQTLSVTFTPTDSSDYSTATSTVQLTVNKAAPVVPWAAPAEITYGTALSAAQLDASSTVAGTFVYTPAAGAVPTAGLQTLSVTFTPTDSTDYSTATSTVQLTVNEAAPVVVWAAPTAISYGTALSATQLNANTTVAGTYVYTPAAGVVLTAGLQTLSVTFTPTDSTDYSTATSTVQLTVNKVAPVVTWATPVAIPYGTALSAAQLDASSTVAGTFVYTPAAGAVLTAGLQTLSVTFTPADSTDYSTATATVQLTVNKAAPVVTWATPVAIPYGTALSAVQLDAGSTVAGTFVYTPAAGAVLTAGLQTLSVTFTPTDSTDYSTATATVTLTVNKATPAIPWTTPAAIPYGTALSAAQLDASSTVAGTYVYSPAAGAVLTAGLQTLSVTFTPTDSTDYSTATATVQLTVNMATPAVTWATPVAIPYGTALSAVQLDAGSTVAGTFVYTPAAGAVLTAGLQTLSVTFTPTDSTDYSTATSTVQLTVNKAAPAIPWATPAAITYGTTLSAAQLDASSTVAGTYVYSPAAGAVLTAGSQTLSVTFTPTDSSDYSTATATVTLTVNKATPAITLATPAAISYGTALSAAQLDASSVVAGTYVYTPAVGAVLTAGSQTLSVTFTPTDSSDYSTATSTVQLTVNKAAPVVTWAAPAAITYGTALSAAQLNAGSTVGGTYVYTPAAGAVPTAGLQTLSVTFTPTDSSDYSTATSTVQLTVNEAAPVVTWATPAAITYGTALSAAQLDAGSTVAGTYVYTPAAGAVPTAGLQTLSVTFTPTDSSDYSTVTATVTLTVNKAAATVTLGSLSQIYTGSPLAATATTVPSGLTVNITYNGSSAAPTAAGNYAVVETISDTNYQGSSSNTLVISKAAPVVTWVAPAAIPYGTALSAAQLDANSVVAGTYVYTPAVGAVLTAGPQTLSVTFTPTDSSDYSTATATVQLTVNAAAPVIAWAAPAAIPYGTALSAAQLDASSVVAGTFVYTPAAGAVPTAGLQTLSVTFTPTDSSDYSTATATVQLTVNKATPAIIWAVPAAITYGTALSATQLNASSVVAGTYVYTPAAGAVPTAGLQTLSVTFTPTDSNDYSTATATVQLTVNKAAATVTLGSLSQIYTGSPLAATATTVPSGLTVNFTYNGSSTAPTAVGNYTVVGTISDTNYQGNSSNTLVISRAAPVITWLAPAAIFYGTPLSAAQLDASSTAAGTFAYSPPAGTGLTVGSQTLTVTFTPTDSSDYSTATSTVQLTVNKATPAIIWATPAAIPYGTALSAAQLNASSTAAGTFVYTPAAGVVLGIGSQTLSVTLTPTDSNDYSTATSTVQLTVNATTQTISFTASSTMTYGCVPITLTATGGASGNPVTFSVLSGPGSITGSTLIINGAGSVVVAANQAGNGTYAAATQVTQSIVVNPAPSAIAIASGASTVLAQNAVTLTATVSSPAGIPTGTVSFLDGTTPLGPGTLSGGVATLTTSLLTVGTHSISAVYSGGTNFVAATSAVLTQCVMDISLSDPSAGGTSQTVTAGGNAIYSLAIAPSSGTTFPVAVTLTVSGLPTTTTASLTPAAWVLSSNNPWTWTLPANTPLTSNSQLTIQLSQSLAQTQPNGAAGGNLATRLAPFSLALLILPFAGRMRRASKRLRRAAFVLLLLVASVAAMAGLSGCGSPSVFFSQQMESYSVTVTVSAGTLSHSMPVTLVVE